METLEQIVKKASTLTVEQVAQLQQAMKRKPGKRLGHKEYRAFAYCNGSRLIGEWKRTYDQALSELNSKQFEPVHGDFHSGIEVISVLNAKVKE